MYARMAIYNFNGDDSDAKSLSSRAEQGILPILQAQPGFRAYSVATGDGEVLSLSVWDTVAEAEAGNATVGSWVASNMADELELTSLRYAEIQFSTTLGISTTD